MKISDISFEVMHFPLQKPFHVAFGTISSMDTCIVRIRTDDGMTGWGEAAPLPYVTGDNLETILSVGNDMKRSLTGMDPRSIGTIHNIMDSLYDGNTAVKAGIDLACYDLASKKAGVPLYVYLGGSDPHLVSDVTIGIDRPDIMAAEAVSYVNCGFSILKIKLGETVKADVERIAAIRKAVGEDVILRTDANQGWCVRDAVRVASLLEQYGVDLIEQPVKAWDIEGLQEVKANSHIRIAADESVHLPQDAMRIARTGGADVVNIKLMKCGGIYRALQINAICEAAGISCMIGCMGESPLANAAGLHLAAALRNLQEIDLDSGVILKHDHMQAGYLQNGSNITLGSQPGIGFDMEGEQ